MMVKVSIRDPGAHEFTELGSLERERAIRFFGLCERQAEDVRIQLVANGVDVIYHLPGDRRIGFIRDHQAEASGSTQDGYLVIEGMNVALGSDTDPIYIWGETFDQTLASLPSFWTEIAVRGWIRGYNTGSANGKAEGRSELQRQMRGLLDVAPKS